MTALTRLNAFACAAGGLLAGLAVVTMALFILYEVMLRHFFNTSSFMLDLVVGHAVQTVIFCGLGYSFSRGVHIRITLFTTHLNRALTLALELIWLVLSGAIFGYLGWFLLRDGLKQFSRGAMTDTIVAVPVWISNLIICTGIAIFLIAVLTRFVTVLVTGRPPAHDADAVQI